MAKEKPEWRVIVELLENVDPILLNRITRKMIYYLYTRHIPEIISLMKELEPSKSDHQVSDLLYPNVPHPKKDLATMKFFVEEVFKIAGDTLAEDEISGQIGKWLAQERSRFLSLTVDRPNATLHEIAEALNRFFTIAPGETHISPDKFVNIRVSLIRRFLSDHLPYIIRAKHFITVRDFSKLLKRVIGSAQSTGKLGGKSAGLIIGFEIIKSMKKKYPILENVRIPESWFITTDTTMDFIHYNALEELIGIKYLDIEEVRAGYPFLKQLFKHSFFTSEIINQLEGMLNQIGPKPIIVRSSSLLEDSFGAAFSGKYKSLFLSNTGPKNERLASLLDAIAEIYASVFSPDPIEYRKERGLLDFNEGMGILIQEVVGNNVGDYFFPLFAGVAFSNNEFRWSPRIRREDGAVRIVFGLGTRAVDRVGDDYSFLASPGKPGLRVTVDPADTVKYAQKNMDVLNLRTNAFMTVPVSGILKQHSEEIFGLEKIVSLYTDSMLRPTMGTLLDYDPEDLVVTFQGLMENSDFLKQMDIMLKVLKDTLEWPVDVEFASDGKHLYFLQCRPQGVSRLQERPEIPENIDRDRVLFSTNRFVTSGMVRNVRYVVYVVPGAYDSLPDADSIKRVADGIAALNHSLDRRSFILIGPGRWGSRGDIKLGVPVAYSDINNTAMLVEVACKKGDYVPDLSFGTHFFQDLVESQILYLPLYPDDNENMLRLDIFEEGRNRLVQHAPAFGDMSPVIRVIDMHDLEEDATLTVAMDGDRNKALAYIELSVS
ncbi:MAG TPA: PEP/pyruvate-binding domain-containing protein [Thermoanaerobaculia bacterium]|nr:PEP/pyruvate-binding domain-containing protein [Thermoanaerobaculia bacterium]HUM28674.1 PEP/pyruvate-binding domain-containing protein [Thermoanaerobaculia bacterium]HXK66718.1 PEP/pyruvate-binding domain-containing protein [Thermoanaerobaculia bacterium]